jgi:hypothetical protein
MHATTLFAAATGIASVTAIVQDIGVPKTIKYGDKFNITSHQTIGQGYGQWSIIFGIQSAASAVYPDTLGDPFAGPFDMRRKSLSKSHAWLVG